MFDLPEEEKAGLVCIGQDVVESARYVPPKVYILRKVFLKYADPKAKKSDSKVHQAERPPSLIQGGRYDESFAAHVIANRLGVLPRF
ncbi:MAG: hypothetical protein AAFP90_24625 [Planctomycetota bacterium]